MTIAIIGAGNMGGALGRAWARAGHRIHYGVRDPGTEKVRELLVATGPAATAHAVETAVADADIVLIATPWAATEAAVRSAGDLGHRIVIDCTNPLRFMPGIGLELAVGFTDSGAEQIARWARGGRVVKAFNTYGWENFAQPTYPNAAGLRPLLFIAADDAAAKATTAELATAIGFEPFDAGSLRAARELEPIAMLWIRRAMSGARSSDFTWARLTR